MPAVVVAPYGTNALPEPRGIITTSPFAAWPVDDRLNTMLPLLPVTGLLYSPVHFPASDARSSAAPVTVTGVGFDAHASDTQASTARHNWVIFTKKPLLR